MSPTSGIPLACDTNVRSNFMTLVLNSEPDMPKNTKPTGLFGGGFAMLPVLIILSKNSY